jgi:ArsR family transcriptional regulator
MSHVSTRPRPPDCCTPVGVPDSLPAAELESTVGVFKALADSNRVEILRLIAAQAGPICVCDIVDRFDLSQPTISHHLKVLREAGLVTVSRRGVWAYYAPGPELSSLRARFSVLEPGPGRRHGELERTSPSGGNNAARSSVRS